MVGLLTITSESGDDDAAILQMKMNNMGRKNSTR
jgi:hypothetical protein